MAKLSQSKAASGVAMSYLKYDAMIMACALRSGVSVIVTTDPDHHPLAQTTGIQAHHPSEYKHEQTSLFDTLLPPVAMMKAPSKLQGK
jgi:hypothetical protein